MDEMRHNLREGCGAVILAEEALSTEAAAGFLKALECQPSWSDIPVTIITGGDEATQRRLRRRISSEASSNVMLLGRPFHPETFISTMDVALRSRMRQYQVRDLLLNQRTNEQKMQGILESISDAFAALDTDWRFTYVNQSYMKLVAPLYSSPTDLLGESVWDKFPDTMGTEIEDFYRHSMESQKADSREIYYPPLDAWLELRVYPSPQTLAIYVQNITERKQHEEQLKELNRKIASQALLFDATLSHMSDLAYTFDTAGRVIYANKPLLDIWGMKLEEVVGKTLLELGYSEELAKRLNGEFQQVISSGQPLKGETTYASAAGVVDYHEYIFNPIIGEDGNAVAIAGTTRLITERRQSEYASRRLAAIVESCEDAIFSKDLNGNITSWNDGARRLFGYEAEEIIGKSVIQLIPEERHNEEPSILDRIVNGQRIQHYETVRRHKDGSLVDVSLTISPIKDAAGAVIGASKIVRDISERKAVDKALQEAKEIAEAANHAKDRFLAVLSHELRTPLTPVLMTVASLEVDPELRPDVRQDLSMIRRNVELETKLIDDLLDVSRVTSGKLHLQFEVVDLNDAVQQVCGICRPQVLEKGIRLHYEPDPDVGCVKADPARFQQVLWNVLKNAAKFTPENGNIFISTHRTQKDTYEVRVRDTGIGIKDTMLPLIFNAFEQGDEKITSQFGGLGLGLAISKALVELHSGSIRVTSEGIGKGSTFIVELPRENCAMTVPPSKSRGDQGSSTGELRLLVVEDHVDSARTLGRLLRASGYSVKTAESVASALEIVDSEEFHLVISDIGLPDATGYELMSKIRQKHGIKGIAMSGYGREDDIERSREAGFSEHLTKPLDIAKLRQAILRVMGG